MKFQKIIVAGAIAGLGAMLMAYSGAEESEALYFHTQEELDVFRGGGKTGIELPVVYNSLFASSGRCGGCHGFDPNEVSSRTGEGADVNITDDWRSTMMANSAKDPFWRAKVSHEVAVNPQHQNALETTCTSCHAPGGHFAAIHDGAEFYTMEMLATDTMGLDGVNCVACHQQKALGIGNQFSGQLEFEEGIVYGPFSENIFGAPMISFVGYEPLYSEHIVKSEACAGCHSLLTNTVTLEGEITGDQFIEQATYHEWLNSTYSIEGASTECQDCHMPALNEPIIISNAQPFLPGREPFAQHELVGANTFMLELMKNRRVELDIKANEEQYDETIAKTYDMLQNRSIEMVVEDAIIEDDSVLVEVSLVNIAGHKFPSGYPSRRAFIEVVVTGDDDVQLFSSGVLQEDYEVQGQDPVYEPHYDKITAEDQVQIYEMVFGDVEGNVSTVLERAASTLKDNRLVPIGFSTGHIAYDTTAIVGSAETDPNFNLDEDGIEGNGGDKIQYKIGLDDYEGQVNVSVKLFYQSLPPKWMEEMFSFNTPEIDAFRTMYEEEGPDPVLIKQAETGLFYVGVEENEQKFKAKLYPNPVSSNGFVWLETPSDVKLKEVRVYDMRGRLLMEMGNPTASPLRLDLNGMTGTLLIEAVATDGRTFVDRVLK